MNIFEFRNHLVQDYQAYISSFIRIRDPRICHQCGGSIVGKITSFKQHFEAQEKYLGITDADDYSDNSEE